MTSEADKCEKAQGASSTYHEKSAQDEATLAELNRLGEGGLWLMTMFLLISSTGILNGLQTSSNVFLSPMPEAHWCDVPELANLGWSDEQIRAVSVPNSEKEQSCKMYIRNYTELEGKSSDELKKYLADHVDDPTTSCKSGMKYMQEDNTSIVPEWGLVCERLYLRSISTTGIYLGKLIGAFLFGIFADKYGRKTGVLVGSVIFIVSGPIASVTTDYTLFVFLRTLVGLAGIGVYNCCYTLLSELAGAKHRAWMSIVINLSYPIGMLILPGIAYRFHLWRDLQLAISLPALLLVIHCWFLPESPRWLINKGQSAKAAKIVFGKKYEADIPIKNDPSSPAEEKLLKDNKTEEQKGYLNKVKNGFKEVTDLFKHTEMRNRLCICLFTWMACSLSYYAMAINDINLDVNRYIYVVVTATLEMPSYFIPLPLIKYLGRRMVNFILFMAATACFIPIMAIPAEYAMALMVISLVGRLFMSGVFAVVILHTLELFPTSNRNTASGLSSTMANLGGVLAPFIVDLLGAIAWQIPMVICGLLALCSGILVLLLPETKGKELCDTPEEIDLPGQGKVSIKNICNRS